MPESFNSRVTVALDAMGHDKGPKPLVQGAIGAVKNGITRIILVGNEEEVKPLLDKYGNRLTRSQIEILHTDDKFEIDKEKPDDNPIRAMRRSPNAPVMLAVQIVANGNAYAAVSAGDTGAAVYSAHKEFTVLEEGLRPAIASIVPGKKHPTVISDTGARPDPDAEPRHYVDRMIMAEAYYRMTLGLSDDIPLGVGLLNIGQEPYKGYPQRKAVYQYMRKHVSNFTGNIEGSDILVNTVGGRYGEFESSSHIVVADADIANAFLKTTKGTIKFLRGEVEKHAMRHAWSIMTAAAGAIINWRTIKKLKEELSYEKHGGSPFLGVDNPFIIAHGSSKPEAIEQAVLQARTFNMDEFRNRIGKTLEEARRQAPNDAA
ncbi:MAG: hypothetical protein O2904_01575 [bacterium]|nr:hypothetical protein [bacterium]